MSYGICLHHHPEVTRNEAIHKTKKTRIQGIESSAFRIDSCHACWFNASKPCRARAPTTDLDLDLDHPTTLLVTPNAFKIETQKASFATSLQISIFALANETIPNPAQQPPEEYSFRDFKNLSIETSLASRNFISPSLQKVRTKTSRTAWGHSSMSQVPNQYFSVMFQRSDGGFRVNCFTDPALRCDATALVFDRADTTGRALRTITPTMPVNTEKPFETENLGVLVRFWVGEGKCN